MIILEEFNSFGQNLKRLSAWPDINELRLLTNHGDGSSETPSIGVKN